MRVAAPASRHNIVTIFGRAPAFTEPCVTLGSIPSVAPDDPYSVYLIKVFLIALQSFVAGHTHRPLFEVFQMPVNRTKLYK